MVMLLTLASAFAAASPCGVTDRPSLLRLANEFHLAEPARTRVPRTDGVADSVRYHRRRINDRMIELTIVTVNEQPLFVSYVTHSLRITVRGRIRAAHTTCTKAREMLTHYLAATAR